MGLVVKRWQRPGQERLYVNVDGTRDSLGYYDCKAGRLELRPEHADRQYEVMEVLRPFLGSKAGRLELRPEHADRQYEVMEVLRPFLGSAVPEWLRGQMIDQPPPKERPCP